ncbi:peptidoglycan-binding protein [Streptomyces sp. NPDC048392]|uniref:peptidoglycan-binding domain-containing protein n=1 Tax=Streptomyces sp. NPDC048392 TaxID=3365543 RepID=UPI003724A9DF
MTTRLVKRFKFLFTAGTLTAILGSGLAATTPAAAASPVECNSVEVIPITNGFEQRLPAYNNTAQDCYLLLGSRGPEVEALQMSLKVCYDYGIAADGIFGPQTRSSLIAVQKKIGVTVDGEYGYQTYSHMRWPYRLRSGGSWFCG